MRLRFDFPCKIRVLRAGASGMNPLPPRLPFLATVVAGEEQEEEEEEEEEADKEGR